MKKHLPNKIHFFANLLGILFIGLSSFSLNAQCIMPSPYGSSTLSSGSTPAVILDNCNWASEYVVLTINDGGVYQFTSSTGSDYLTLTDASNNVIDHGQTPLTASISTSGTYRLHIAASAACNTASGCRVTTGEYIGPNPTVVVIGTGTLASTTTQNGSPIYRSSTTSAFDYAQSVQLLTQADLAAAGITPGSTITKIAYRKTSPHTLSPGRTATYRAYAKNSTATALVTSQNFNTWISGATLVYQNLAMDANDIPAAADSWVELSFSSPFTYTGDALEIALDWEMNPGVGDRSTGAFLWEYTNTPTNQAVGTSSSGVITGNLTTGTARLYNCQITFFPGANCTGVTPPGQTISNLTNVCPNNRIELSIQNPSIGGGIEYQWESSLDGSNWNSIVGADQADFQTNQSVATYYRAKVECVPGSVSAYTSPIFISMNSLCPAFAVYNGNIGTEYNTSPTTLVTSACAGFLTVNIPQFAIIDSVSVSYDMEARNGAFISEQRSYIRCTNPGGQSESALATASGTGGVFSYNRTGLDIANNVIGGGNIDFEINAFRTWGGTTCDDFYNYIMDGSLEILVYYTIPPLCSGQPNAGSISGIPAIACSGSNFQLGLSGATADLGIQYYWQMAPTPSGPWVLVDSGAVFDTVLTQNTWVRSYNLCSASGLSDTTTAVQISLTNPISGNYTINQNAAASATNFTSFNDLISSLGCGVSGPVVIDVVPNTGPYNERVEFGEILGVSATNTITINGNGNLLSHTAANTNERTAFMLNGTDYMTIDSLNIEALGTWAWGIQLMNEADYNTIKNCRIEVPMSSTSTFFANVVMSGSITGATTTGASGSFNTFENNHNIGGYYSYTMVGQSAANRSQGNKIINCVMEDMALYGVFCSQQAGTEIIGNDISRASRNTGSTYYGIYFNSSEPAEISSNKVHDIANNLTTTTATYPFYLTGTGGASAMNPLKIFNNICYNINSNGVHYGVYILGTSNNIDFYHNTIVLDHSGHPGASTIAGFYHTGVATNVDLKNNIFYIDNGSSGAQYQLWFSNSSSSPTSNNNVFFNTNANGILARRGTTNYASLIDWQPVLNNDLNSVFLDPTFAGASVGVLIPGDQLVNLGASGTGVTTDIEGAVRSVGSPTPGAFELKPCDSPPVPGNLAATDTLFCAGGDATLTMPNLSLGIGQTYQWQSSSDNVSWSDMIGEISPVLTVTNPTLTYYRCNVTCSAVTVASSSLQIGAFPSLSGTVSINQNAPSSLTNFQSFQDLTDALACSGLGGPLVVNVEPNSGPYTEQVVITEINNASSTNTLTINGNGNVLQFEPVSAQRYIVYLDGADHIIIDSLNILSTSTTFGWGVLLNNDARDNVIRNCSIDLSNVISTVSTNCGGIVMSGSFTTMINAANTGSNNLFENNTITGGENSGPFYGISLYGNTLLEASNNTVRNNTITNTWADAIRFSNMPNVTIEGNTITRQDRSGTTTFYGVHALGTAGNNTGMVIRNNMIASINENISESNTNQMTGIYIPAAGDALNPTFVYNNIVHLNKTNGTHYGIWITQPNIKMYHNTLISESSTSTTGLTRLFYYSGTAANADGIDFINNIAYVDRTGTTAKHPIYTSQAFTNSNIDYNLYFINAPNSAASGVGFRGGNQATLANWQAVDGGAYDQNSMVGEPAFTNIANYDFTPLAMDVDNIGTPLASVSTDIEGSTRSATTPDVGAIEFTGLPGDIAVISAELIRESLCYGNNDSVAVTIRNLFGSPIDFSTNPLTLVWHVTGPINTSDSAVLNMGVLPAGIDFRLVTDGIDMSIPGTYTLNGYIKPNAVNASAANDTLVDLVEVTVPLLFDVNPKSLTITNPNQMDNLTASSLLFPTPQLMITEICHFRTANGAPVGGWPTWLIADDYIELTGVPNTDISGYTIEMWSSSGLTTSNVLAPGTVLSPQGTAIIATGQLNTSVPSPANYYYHSGYTGTMGSTTSQGYVIKDRNGSIVDVVVYGNINFPAAANVTAADWSGTTPAVSSSGNRLEGAYTKDATNWVNSGTAGNNNGQDPNTVNQNVVLPTPPPLVGLQWSLNNQNLGIDSEQPIGPFDTSGTYVFIAQYNSACGIFIDSAVVNVDLTKVEVFSFTQTTCLTATDAQATVLASGGDAPYTYLWNDPLNQITPTANNLGVGTYMVIVKDANLHPDTAYVTITNGDASPPTVVTQNITVALDANGDATILAGDVDMGSFDNCDVASMSVSPNMFNCSNLGPNTVTLSVVDNAGNIGTGTAVVTIIDNIAPVVNTQNISVFLDAIGNANITASQINNGSTDNCGIDSMFLDVSSFGCADVGANTVSLSVVDESTNVGTGTAIVTVFDTISPTITTHFITTIYLDAMGQAIAIPADVDNGSSDACGIDMNSFTLSKTIFSCADVGNNMVTFSASDVNNNTSSSFAIINVADTISPVVVTRNINVYLDASGEASINAAMVDSMSSDNCGIQSMSLDKTSFDCSDIGANTVTLTVVDDQNNSSSGTATVTVIDTISPLVVTQDITVYLNASGNASIVPGDVDNGSNDSCGIFNMTLDIDNFNCANVGPNLVTLSVTDVNNNTSSGTATVTVVDTISPNVIAQGITIYLDASGNATANPADVNNGSTDACGIDPSSFALSQTSFTCVDLGDNSVTFSLSDVNNNTASTSVIVTVEDTINPMAVSQDITVYLDANATVTISGLDIDGGSTDNCSVVNRSVSKSTFNCDDLGLNTITFVVFDGSGNMDSTTAEVTVIDTNQAIIQTRNPTVYLDSLGNANITFADLDSGSVANCGIASITVTPDQFSCADIGPNSVNFTIVDVSNNVTTGNPTVTILDSVAPVVTVYPPDTVYVGSNTCAALVNWKPFIQVFDACSPTFTISSAQPDVLLLGGGTHVLQFTVEDMYGNSRGHSHTFHVIDTFPPVITGVPADVTLAANSNCEAPYSWTSPTASDNCTGVSMSATHVPGSIFPIGTTTVTYTATDAGGLTTVASFNVNVLDQTAPTVITQNITLPLSAAGSASLSPSAIDNGSFDLCSGIMNMSVSPSSFNCSNVGQNTVVLSVMDSAGNTATGTAIVSVEDVTAPNAIAQNATVYLNASGIATLSASMIDNGSTDGCGTISSLSVSPSSFSCADLGTNTVTLSVFDPSGNVGTATAVVTVLDTISPILSVSNTTVGLDSNGTVTVSTSQMAGSITENCSIDSITVTPNTFTCANVGPNVVTVTVVDISGNTTTQTAIVTIVDNIAPVAMAQNQTVYLDATGQATLIADSVNDGSTDNCSSTLSFSLSQASFDCSDLGNQTITFFATDADNNVGSTTINVTVLDTIAPVASTLPPGTIYVDNTGCNVLFDWMSTISTSDACSQVNLSSTMANPVLLGVGTHVINFTLTDASNNARNYAHTIIVQDTISPNLSGMPANISVNAGSSGCGANVNWTAPSASDNCSGVNLTASHSPGSFFPLGTTTVNYTATDASNNSVSGSFTVTVTDNTGPIINAQPATVALDMNGTASIVISDVLTASGITDNCGVLSSSLSQTTFNCSNLGPNTVTITATDVNNNVSTQSVVVNVVDNMAPTVNTNNVTLYLGTNGQATLTPAMANNNSTDNCSIVGFNLSQSNFNCADLGVNAITLSAFDASNNVGTGTLNVTVLDTIKPNINGLPSNLTANASTAIGACGANVSWTPPTVSDNCLGAVLTSSHAPGAFFPVGTTTVTYTATDISNNIRTLSFTVTVTDVTGPVINGQPATVYLDATGSASIVVADVLTAAGVTDNCAVQTTTLSQSTFGCANIGTNNLIITATDVNSNTSNLSVVVTVIDTITPVLTNVPANITTSNDAGLCGAIVNWPTITATDNCPSPLVVTTPPSGSFFSVGTHVVNVVVTDASNNQSTASFTVTVEDTEAPVVTSVPSDQVLGHCMAVFNYNLPTASDNCGSVTVTQAAGLASGSTFPTGTTTNTFEITDVHNNSVTVSFDVTITPQYNDYTASNITLCRNDNAIDLTNGIANVTFAGSGLLPDGITFSPALSGTGNHQIIASFTDSMGCVVTSTFFILVNPNPDVPIINQVSSTQLRVQQQFTTYQWFRNGVPIAGATQQVLNITQTGVYQVEVGNVQGCKTMSDQFGVGVNVSVHDFDKEITNIKLYPNPSRGKITLEFPNPNAETHLVRIIDMAGRVVFVRPVDKEIEEFDLSHLAQGAYMLQLSNGTQNSIKPFIIGQ